MSITLDAQKFDQRSKLLQEIHQSLKQNEFCGVDSLVFCVGQAEDELSYQKSTALHTWLLGYEFPDTAILINGDKFVFLTSQKKGDLGDLGAILETLKSDKVEILKRSKDDAHNKEMMAKFVAMLPSKVGHVQKDQATGKFAAEWKKELQEKNVEMVDVSAGMAVVFATKDDSELKIMQQASKMSCNVMKNYFIPEMSSIIDSGKKVSHSKFTTMIEESLMDERKRAKLKFSQDISPELAEWCYPPIVQSGGKYDLRPSAQSNESNLHPGTIVCSFGVRYKSYCTNIARTFLINPEKKEENYEFLLKLQEHVLSLLKDGVTCNAVYSGAIAFIEQNRPDLKAAFLKNCGFGIGIEFRESQYLLAMKSSRPLRAGQVVNLSIGFQNLESKGGDSKNRVYSLFVGDTVQITDGESIIMTGDVEKSLKSISFTLGDDDDDVMDVDQAVPRGAILDKKLRNEKKNADKAAVEARRRVHQKSLAEQRHQEGLARFSTEKAQDAAPSAPVFKKFESYRKDNTLPKTVSELRIVVDRRAESIVLPIYGQAVPFHISTLKNVSKSDEQDFVLLRFNFITPGVATGKKEPHAFEDQEATFVRALSFRSTDTARLTEICREINELKKDVTKREAERAEKADLVEQEDLIEIKGRRPIRLPDVFARPGLEGKRYSGDLEIHANGLRYQSHVKSDQRINVTFSNIKHFFFQPCDGEMLILIHIQLKDAIMVGKRKTTYVQFYREVSDASFDETGNRRRRTNYGDEDELAQEQEERRHRQMLNKEFQQFSDRVSELSKKEVDVDSPFRDLGFMGVPHRQLALMQPTTDCLVHLSETPPLVVTLSEVEIAHLERVQFGLKNFDLVFVFKDFSKPVVHVNTIPMDQLENVKSWLDSVDIPFTEGPVNLSWPQIMKTITDDPRAFFEEAGGWSFLSQDAGSDGTDSEDEVSEFEDQDSDEQQSESESEDSAESDFSSGDDSEQSGSDEEGNETGEDWDELEKKAAKADQRKRDRDGSEEDRPKKRK